MIRTIEPVALIHNDFKGKFGVPRQSGLHSGKSLILFEQAFRSPDCLKGIEGYSHLWLIWGFSENVDAGWSPTVRPPRLGGNVRRGVFASRSPFRPNGLGLSCVRLLEYRESTPDGPALIVSGADLMDGTPIYDIKPFVPYSDLQPDALSGFAASKKDHYLMVDCDPALLAVLPEEKREPLLECLALDPRPSYHRLPERVYGMSYAGFEVRFRVEDETLFVVSIDPSAVSDQ